MAAKPKLDRSSKSDLTSTTAAFLILVRATESTAPTTAERDRGFPGKALKAVGESVLQYVQVPPDYLEAQVNGFLGKLQGVLNSLPQMIGGFALEEIELSAEITAEGEVAFLGTGGKLGGTAGLTFTFKRKVSSK